MREDHRQAPRMMAAAQGEDIDTSPDHVVVRAVLQSLPKLEAPAGFEFRLQRRLEGADPRPSRSAIRTWSLGWAGAGLGVATAFIIGIFVFNIHLSGGPGGVAVPMAGNSQVKTSTPVVAPPVETASDPAQVQGPTPLVADNQQKSVAKDSGRVQAPTGQVPEEIFHTTGTSGR